MSYSADPWLDDPLSEYPFWDVLHDYLSMADYWPQDDPDVSAYREELERRGCLIVTEEQEVEPNQGSEGYNLIFTPNARRWIVRDDHPSLTAWERNI